MNTLNTLQLAFWQRLGKLCENAIDFCHEHENTIVERTYVAPPATAAEKEHVLGQWSQFRTIDATLKQYDLERAGFFDVMYTVLEKRVREKNYKPLTKFQMRACLYQQSVILSHIKGE